VRKLYPGLKTDIPGMPDRAPKLKAGVKGLDRFAAAAAALDAGSALARLASIPGISIKISRVFANVFRWRSP